MKPIRFNTDMTRSLLDGNKTVTRRRIKPQPREIYHGGTLYEDDDNFCSRTTFLRISDNESENFPCKSRKQFLALSTCIDGS